MFFGKTAPRVDTSEEKVEALLSRSVVEPIPSRESFKKLLMSGKRLRVKLGIDPTSPHLHLGRSVPLLKLRDFQELGHQVVLIAGDFTGLIGDTSDKESERPMLDEATVAKNMTTYREQAGKLLDLHAIEFRRNSEWLAKLGYREIGEQADQFSVADFISRELIKKRLDEGKRVSLREVLYPLMQGYDSVAIKADIELGSTDQRFNLLAGRTLQEHYGQPAQHILLLGPLLPGTDGRKMSSSWGNTVNLTEAPQEMFGKLMSIPDALTEQYLTHVTRLPLARVAELMAGHPKAAKVALAKEVVRMYHTEAAAEKAAADFESTFSKGEAPKDAPEIPFRETLMKTLVEGGTVPSNAEYRRLQEAGAIRYADTDEVFSGSGAVIGKVMRVGKHRFVKIIEK
ncbi:MAG: tyrosine--tRNA ligase [Patescibacteria group bacterium]|nr:tyrosine--tRNA ligase [Patescibacteria group bacterium]